MKSNNLFSKLVLCFALSIFALACSKTETPAPKTSTPTTEFVAQDADFKDFKNWTVVANLQKALSSDGRAHTDAARTIWINKNINRGTNGEYSLGTIFVKEVQGGYGIVGMAKRGGSFNAQHNGWEWFRLDINGKITDRNSSNTCNSCHAKVKNLDYAFTKP
jgi:hypothetical protein